MKSVVTLTAFLLSAGAVFGQQSGEPLRSPIYMRSNVSKPNGTRSTRSRTHPKDKHAFLPRTAITSARADRLYNKAQDIEAMIVSRRQNQESNTSLKFLISDMRMRMYGDVAVVTAMGTSITRATGSLTAAVRSAPFHV